MRILFFLCIVFGLISCEKKTDQKEYEPYVISEVWDAYQKARKNPERDENGNILPPPPHREKWGYGYENFIIDDSLNVFYYEFQPRFTESCIETEDDTIPYFQDLRPGLLIQLPKESLVEFVKLNFKRGIRNKVKIASQKDTLNSKAYYDLLKGFDKYLDRYYDGDIYGIFATTQEEDTVLYYKKHRKWYNPDSIKWDKKRIQFLKPKVDE